MRKWLALAALGATAAAGIAYRWYRKGRQGRSVKRFVAAFIAALEKNDLQAIMNETTLAKDHWTDVFAGTVSEKPFHFLMQVELGGGRVEKPGAPRRYRLQWGESFLDLTVERDETGKPHAFERIHALLAKLHRRLSETRPS